MNEGLLTADIWRWCIAPRLSCVRDLVNLSIACKHLRTLLSDQVNVARIQAQHLVWTQRYFRAQKSMLQAWCHKLYRAFKQDDGPWRVRDNDKRSMLHSCLASSVSIYGFCHKCGELRRDQDVKCFVDWIEEDCLCCVMETEYSFICNGSANEEEEENKYEFKTQE